VELKWWSVRKVDSMRRAADHLIIWLEIVQTKVMITPTQKSSATIAMRVDTLLEIALKSKLLLHDLLINLLLMIVLYYLTKVIFVNKRIYFVKYMLSISFIYRLSFYYDTVSS